MRLTSTERPKLWLAVMYFVLQMMDFPLMMMNSVLNMTDFGAESPRLVVQMWVQCASAATRAEGVSPPAAARTAAAVKARASQLVVSARAQTEAHKRGELVAEGDL